MWPITNVAPLPLGEADRAAVRKLARRLRRDEPALGSADAFAPDTCAGYDPNRPRLAYEDHRAITFARRPITPRLAYRAFTLAGDGDLTLVPAPRAPAFEAYWRDVLGAGAPKAIELALPSTAASAPSLARACREDVAALGEAAAVARHAGGLNVAPYLVDGDAWLLAQAIGREAGVATRVAGPTPRLARRANDKLWFTARVIELLGRGAAPPTFTAFSPSAAAARVLAITRRGRAAVVKAPSSAGGMGNVTWNRERAAGRALSDVVAELTTWAAGLGADPRRPLLVGVWDEDVTASPSAQVWIPAQGQGEPVVEGVFLQEVVGPSGAFIGSAPAALPRVLDVQLRHQATLLAVLLQHLGYVGRCCFDAVTVADRPSAPSVRWIECNARWSGVSMPMTLVNRLTGDWRETPFVVVQRTDLPTPRGGTDALLALWSDLLYRAHGPRRGIVLLGPPAEVAGLRCIALGAAVSEARSIVTEAVERLGPPPT